MIQVHATLPLLYRRAPVVVYTQLDLFRDDIELPFAPFPGLRIGMFTHTAKIRSVEYDLDEGITHIDFHPITIDECDSQEDDHSDVWVLSNEGWHKCPRSFRTGPDVELLKDAFGI